MTRINRRVKEVLGSSTLAITARAKQLKAEGHDVVNFAAGEPDFDTPDFIKEAAIKALDQGFTKYTPSTGMPALREAIATKLKNENGITYPAHHIIVGCGAKHSVYSVIQVLTEEGDEVIIPTPYWVSYPEMVKIAGSTPVFVETSAAENFKLTATKLEQAITDKSRLLILNSPSNPTGMMYTKDELQAIADVCVKHNLYVLSDEIYEKLIYTDDGYVSLASLGKEIYDLTFTVNGVSKAYSMTGWRIGYTAVPDPIVADYMKKLQDHSTSNPTSISQYAALAAISADQGCVQEMTKIFKQRLTLMMSLLDTIPQVSYIIPQGAFYIFVDVSSLGSSMDVATKILDDKHVAIIPGEGFGAPGFVRMSFSTSEERIKEGVSRIKSWIEAHQ